MDVEYKITKYFEDNGLFKSDSQNGLIIKSEADSVVIKGDSRDLVGLADILVSIAKQDKAHMHIDDLTLINKESEISEIIIEKDLYSR